MPKSGTAISNNKLKQATTTHHAANIKYTISVNVNVNVNVGLLQMKLSLLPAQMAPNDCHAFKVTTSCMKKLLFDI